MKKNLTAAAQFSIAFFSGIIVLAIPFAIALLRFAGDKIPVSPAQEEYFPQSSDAISMAIALSETKSAEPYCVVICAVEPKESRVSIAVLPPQTMAESAGRLDYIANIWRQEGGEKAVTALSGMLGIGIDRWIMLNSSAIASIGEMAGAVDFTLKNPVGLEDGMLMLPAGRQIIDGRKASLLMANRGYEGGQEEQLEMIALLLSEGIEQRVKMQNEQLLELLFETIVNNADSNLSIGDFESRRRALVHMASRGAAVRVIEVNGEYNAETGGFLPYANVVESLQQAFSFEQYSAL